MLLQKVKISLRIKNNAIDEEVLDLIDAAFLDLGLSGVANATPDDPLIIRAVIIYCKANFGLDNKDSEKYQRSYESLKNHMSLSGDYNV